MSCRAQIYQRARIVAERYQMDAKRACQSLTPIGVNGTLLDGSTGETYNQAIFDTLAGASALPGDHIQFESLGSQKYLILGLINAEESGAVRREWGYRGIEWNGNDVKNNFESSFSVDAVHNLFFNVEAIRSGIEAFPWECVPAFGPNDKVRIGLWSRAGLDIEINLLAYAMPVPVSYKPPVTKVG
jgi:hypothetical protein